MNLIHGMIDNLNIKYIIVSKEGKVISSNIEDSDLILNIINCGEKENDTLKYKDKYYQYGTLEDIDKKIYWVQDVTNLEEKYRQLKRDDLTKLYIRRVALPLIDDYLIKSCQKHEPFSIVMADIDFFKKINDKYGHDVGDKVLKDVALTLLNNFRTRDLYSFNPNNDIRYNDDNNKDIICRYGGEEFLILIKKIDLQTTLRRLEELRRKIQKKGFVTMSYGVYNFDPNMINYIVDEKNVGELKEKLIKIADKCLYHSKNTGRNKISYFDITEEEFLSNQKRLVK